MNAALTYHEVFVQPLPDLTSVPPGPGTPRPIKNSVLVRQDAPKKTLGSGILHAVDGAETWPTTGTIVAVGPTAWKEGGDALAPGARVLFKRRPNSALEPEQYKLGGSRDGVFADLIMLDDEDILAEISDGQQEVDG